MEGLVSTTPSFVLSFGIIFNSSDILTLLLLSSLGFYTLLGGINCLYSPLIHSMLLPVLFNCALAEITLK